MLEDVGDKMASIDVDCVCCELEDDLEDAVDAGDNKIDGGKLVKSQASIL